MNTPGSRVGYDANATGSRREPSLRRDSRWGDLARSAAIAAVNPSSPDSLRRGARARLALTPESAS
jgi:hypothetical protein